MAGGWGEAASLLVKLGYGTVAPFLMKGGVGETDSDNSEFLFAATYFS